MPRESIRKKSTFLEVPNCTDNKTHSENWSAQSKRLQLAAVAVRTQDVARLALKLVCAVPTLRTPDVCSHGRSALQGI
jgi:hypothetical protein